MRRNFIEESFRLLETNKQENLEHDDNMASAANRVEDEIEVKEEKKFYNVCETGMIENVETCNCSIETDDFSQKEDHEIKENENYKAEETSRKLEKMRVPETYEYSNDHDDVEESKSVTGASQTVEDAEATCKDDQNNNYAESSKEIDDVSSSSSGHDLNLEQNVQQWREQLQRLDNVL